MISNVNSKALLIAAREGSAENFAQALRETGTAVLGNAVETFCKMDREGEQGAMAVEQLKDLKNAIISHLKAQETELKKNETNASSLKREVSEGTHPTHKLRPARTEELTNALAGDGLTYQYLRRSDEKESAVLHLPQVDDMSGLKQFLADLTGVQGLFTAAVMLPGPLALSVKTFAKEIGNSQFSSSASASGSSFSKGFIRRSASEHQESSQTQGSSQYEKVTIDERVVPVLTELQDRLQQASVLPPSRGYLSADYHRAEYAGRESFFTITHDTSVFRTYSDSNRLQRKLEEFAFQPERVRLPKTSISDFAVG